MKNSWKPSTLVEGGFTYKIRFLKEKKTTTAKEIIIETDRPIHGANKTALRRSLNAAFNAIPVYKLENAPEANGSETETKYIVTNFEEVKQ